MKALWEFRYCGFFGILTGAVLGFMVSVAQQHDWFWTAVFCIITVFLGLVTWAACDLVARGPTKC